MLNIDLKEYLLQNGALEVGFADLSKLNLDSSMRSGVSILLGLPKDVVMSISNGPNMDYYDQYHALNAKLNELAEMGAERIRSFGFKAIAQTTDYVKEFDTYRTNLPHKTVATLSGLGWIGKSALFLTKKYGSAIRLSSIITDMDLDYGIPVTQSLCGDCMICANTCPGGAISGKLWSVDVDRDEFFDPLKCRKMARKLAKERIDKEITLCGKCIEVCPYTQAFIHKVERI
jgi:epoxyqueuosine reductase QueG